MYYRYLIIKIAVQMAWYRVFKPELYKHGKALQECLKTPEVQEALDRALRVIIDNISNKAKHDEQENK